MQIPAKFIDASTVPGAAVPAFAGRSADATLTFLQAAVPVRTQAEGKIGPCRSCASLGQARNVWIVLRDGA